MSSAGNRGGPAGKEPPLDSGPPGSLTSYAWYYGAVDAAAPYDVFHWSLTHQHSVIDTLLPDRWAAAHPQSVRQERIAEQQRVSDAKRLRRVRARIAARQASVASQSPC